MSSFENVLIVAFDGLDSEKVEKYGCENLMQSEYGKIDITDFDRFGTPWLWGSFLTGEEHNFRYVKKLENSKLEAMETFFWKNVWPMKKWSGIRGKYLYKKLLGIKMVNHTREDLNSDTFIDELGLESYYVPAYNEYPFNEFAELASTTVDAFTESDVSKEQAFRRHRGFFLRQREELLNLLEEDPDRSMMFYFKFTDSVQHLIFDDEVSLDYMGRKYSEKDLYLEIDTLAGKIKEVSNHDLVIFVSDHGLSEGDHNENAFYSFSSNMGLENPELVDFHDLLLENLEKSDEELDIDF